MVRLRCQAKKGEGLALLQSLLGHQGDECVPWPFAARYPKGYGALWYEGKLTGAHRLMCHLAHGDPPTPKHETAHSCGNRICVNPRHLRWATAVENAADKKAHGTFLQGSACPAARLSENKVLRIRGIPLGRGDTAFLAARFGVARSTINNIRFGKTWRHV